MKTEFSYGTSVIALPYDVKKHISKASQADLKVLIALAADKGATQKEIAEECMISEGEVLSSVAFWRGTGILTADISDEKESAPVSASAASPLLQAHSYTGEEIAALYEKNAELKNTVDKCQQILGKVFTYSEAGVIVYLYDHLRLDCEYILLLVMHCKKKNICSLRYVEKTATGMFDDGITNVGALEARLFEEDRRDKLGYKIRKLFGIGERAFSKSEKTYIAAWTEFDFPFEVFEAGYDNMINAISKISFQYFNKILLSWHEAGVKTKEDAEAQGFTFKESRKKKAEADEESKSSFDVDEMFESALAKGRAQAEQYRARMKKENKDGEGGDGK